MNSIPLINKSDSLNYKKDSVNIKKDSLKSEKDSVNIKKDSLILKKDTNNIYLLEKDTSIKDGISEEIQYSAKDSTVIDLKKNKIFFYKNATTKYGGMEAKSEIININLNTKNISLYPQLDSTKIIRLKDKSRFKQDGSEYLSDTVLFNLDSKKGLTKNSFTTQGEMYIWSNISKKVDDQDIFVKDVKFTTCDLNHPHFNFRSNKGKFRKGKVGVTSATYFEVEDVLFPFPITPFALFPLSTGERNGILPPQYVQTNDRGIGLINGGYYLKFMDYADARIGIDGYTYGSWGINISSKYLLRYKFTGNLNLNYQNLILGIPGDTIRNSNNLFNLSINHNTDAKAMPNANFNIGINISSSKFNSLQITNNPIQNFQNTFGSNISYSQRFKKVPITYSISGTHSQNNTTKRIDVALPSFTFDVTNLLPLQDLGEGNKWYKKLSLKYHFDLKSTTYFYDTLLQPELSNNIKIGAQHNPSISLPLPALGPLIFTPSVSYNEYWTDRQTIISYNGLNKKNDTIINKGLYRYYTNGYSMSLNTSLYGTWLFRKSNALQGIKNVIRPSVSFTYNPNTGRNNFYTFIDANGYVNKKNYYEGALYGSTSDNENIVMNFGFSSSLEIKVRNRKDTSANSNNSKKIILIDNFSINSSYNFTKDSILQKNPLGNIVMSLGTNIAKKLSLNMNGTINPYAKSNVDGSYIPKQYAWQNGDISLGRFSNFAISLSTNFNSSNNKIEKKRLLALNKKEERFQKFLYNDTSSNSNYYNPITSWNINLSYNVGFTDFFNTYSKSNYYKLSGHSLTINGNVALTSSWKIGYSTNLTLPDFRLNEFDKLKVNALGFTVNKDLHCWELSANIIPFGIVKSISFIIRPKSTMLRDVKVEKNRYYREQ